MVISAVLGYTGFRWDRNWLVVNYRGRAYTQRVEPKLALVEIELPDEAFSEGWEPTKNSFMSKISVKFNVSSHKSFVSAIQLVPPKKKSLLVLFFEILLEFKHLLAFLTKSRVSYCYRSIIR